MTFSNEQYADLVDYYVPKRYRDCDLSKSPHATKIINAIKDGKGVFIYGEAGTGKTYLMYAIIKHILGTPELLVLEQTKSDETQRPFEFWEMPEFSWRLKANISKETSSENLIRSMARCKYLFLDDLGVEKMTEFVFENFFIVMNSRYNQLRPCIISSNFSLKEISENINDRISSRIAEMCEIIHLDGDDRRVKRGV